MALGRFWGRWAGIRWSAMSLFFAAGSADAEMSAEEIRAGLFEALGTLGERKRVLAVPPDFTRFHSKAGELTEMRGSSMGTGWWMCCRRWGRRRR